jgi:hypothetical protein
VWLAKKESKNRDKDKQQKAVKKKIALQPCSRVPQAYPAKQAKKQISGTLRYTSLVVYSERYTPLNRRCSTLLKERLKKRGGGGGSIHA